MKLTLRTEFDARIGEYIKTDSRRLQQILYNLLGNALKFSKEGGIVELNISLHSNVTMPERRRPNSYSPDDDKGATKNAVEGNRQCIRFLVKDYGQGIAKGDLRKIFQPFLQASIETERVYGGSGLGLAIVTKLVHGLGGTIVVESEEGEWSEFSILIPYEESPADIQVISTDLINITIILVGNDKETLSRMSDICVQFKVDFINFLSMKEMEAYLAAQRDTFQDRIFVCLVHESLYNTQLYRRASKDSKTVLLTYGLNYGVEESIGHYRSLTHILPFVLMKSISVHAKQSGRPKLTCRQSSFLTNTKSYLEWRILVAEDNVVNQKVISRILNRLGVNNVEVVDNGQKAVEREKEDPFDVILMDMQMPVMDGIDACQHIASRKDGHPKARVVFVTAHASSSFEAECLKAGAVSYLTKPCTIRMVEDCLQKLAKKESLGLD
jgi:CheY-like chemotaxis protein